MTAVTVGNQFGTLITPWQVEQAAISTLSTPPADGQAPLLIYYLAAVERSQALTPRTLTPPPGPSSYRGGVDANTFQAEWMPVIHVVAEPVEAPDALDISTYRQAFTLTISATCGDDDEDTARMIAGSYGTAIARALLDFGALGGISSGTILTRSPDTKLVVPTKRQVLRSTVELTTFIAPLLTVGAPSTFAFDPYEDPGDLPVVLEPPNVTFTAQPLNG